MQYASSTLVGTAMGENNVLKAQKYTKLLFVVGAIIQFLLFLSLNLFKEEIATLFTQETRVIYYITNTVFFAALASLLDGIITLSIGVIKGLGKQASASVAYLVCFYFIGLPFTYVFCFKLGQGLPGLWMGLNLGLLALSLVIVKMLIKTDW